MQTIQTLDQRRKLRVCLPNNVEWLKVIVQAEKKAHTISHCRVIFLAQGLLRIEPVSQLRFLDRTLVLHFERDSAAMQCDRFGQCGASERLFTRRWAKSM